LNRSGSGEKTGQDFWQHFLQPVASPQHFVQAAASLQQEPSHPAEAVVAGLVQEPLPQWQLEQPVDRSTVVVKIAADNRIDFMVLSYFGTT
jgi:hypothetical protein